MRSMHGDRQNLERLLRSAYDNQQRQRALSAAGKAAKMQNKERGPFSRADSYSVLALLVGVFLVIIAPPLWLKAILLLGVCVGVFLFVRQSHWTNSWSRLGRYSAASAIVIILLAVGIPQFLSQWKNEHIKPLPLVTTPTPQPPMIQQLPGPTLDNVYIDHFGNTGLTNNNGHLNMKDSSINSEHIGLDNRNPNAQINLEHSQINGKDIGMVNRGSTKPSNKEATSSNPRKPKEKPKAIIPNFGKITDPKMIAEIDAIEQEYSQINPHDKDPKSKQRGEWVANRLFAKHPEMLGLSLPSTAIIGNHYQGSNLVNNSDYSLIDGNRIDGKSPSNECGVINSGNNVEIKNNTASCTQSAPESKPPEK